MKLTEEVNFLINGLMETESTKETDIPIHILELCKNVL